MFSYWAYILIGNNDTGKTSFQRNLVAHLCGERYARLPRNIVKDVTHPRAHREFRTIFTSNRSYQEKAVEYKSVENYFKRFFKEADVCILSSHTHGDSADQILEMIRQLKQRCYNVAGVFWSNNFSSDAREIAMLPWNELLWVENPVRTGADQIAAQLDQIAKRFADLLIERAQEG